MFRGGALTGNPLPVAATKRQRLSTAAYPVAPARAGAQHGSGRDPRRSGRRPRAGGGPRDRQAGRARQQPSPPRGRGPISDALRLGPGRQMDPRLRGGDGACGRSPLSYSEPARYAADPLFPIISPNDRARQHAVHVATIASAHPCPANASPERRAGHADAPPAPHQRTVTRHRSATLAPSRNLLDRRYRRKSAIRHPRPPSRRKPVSTSASRPTHTSRS